MDMDINFFLKHAHTFFWIVSRFSIFDGHSPKIHKCFAEVMSFCRARARRGGCAESLGTTKTKLGSLQGQILVY